MITVLGIYFPREIVQLISYLSPQDVFPDDGGDGVSPRISGHR